MIKACVLIALLGLSSSIRTKECVDIFEKKKTTKEQKIEKITALVNKASNKDITSVLKLIGEYHYSYVEHITE